MLRRLATLLLLASAAGVDHGTCRTCSQTGCCRRRRTARPERAYGVAPGSLAAAGNVVRGELRNGIAYFVRRNAKPHRRAALRVALEGGVHVVVRVDARRLALEPLARGREQLRLQLVHLPLQLSAAGFSLAGRLRCR